MLQRKYGCTVATEPYFDDARSMWVYEYFDPSMPSEPVVKKRGRPKKIHLT